MSEVKYPAYCPSHLAIHDSAWCTTRDHVSLANWNLADAHAEARRRGFVFFHGDVENLRDSADDPRVGDVVGDLRCVVGGRFHRSYLREVVEVDVASVVWKRPSKTTLVKTTRKSWRAWAKGSWRCSPENGEPTRARWRPS